MGGTTYSGLGPSTLVINQKNAPIALSTGLSLGVLLNQDFLLSRWSLLCQVDKKLVRTSGLYEILSQNWDGGWPQWLKAFADLQVYQSSVSSTYIRQLTKHNYSSKGSGISGLTLNSRSSCLPPPLGCWDYRGAPSTCLFIAKNCPQISSMLDKHSSNWDVALALETASPALGPKPLHRVICFSYQS